MDREEEYQRYAEECLRLSQQATNAESRVLLLEMAAKWRELARRGVKENPS
jgi:hypothetical protein